MEERQSLARDMHDSVNQSIHSLMLFSETLVVLLQKKKIQEALNVSERIQQSGKQALKEIRLLLYRAQFMPIDANLDLLGALEERLNMVERRVGIKAEVSCEEEALANCPREWTENLYWIAMEALNNSLKYSQAQKIWVSIRGTGTNFEMLLEDNGAGFDPRHLRIGGFGMKSMHDRARVLGGAVTITSAPGNGTQVCFRGAVNP
jgi:signal transduction histidine kinase